MKNTSRIIFCSLWTCFLFNCQNNSNRSEKILNAVKRSCNCETVRSDISSYGITFSKGKSSSVGERYEIVLNDCKFTSLDEEVRKIKSALQKENLCEDAFIFLEFKNIDSSKNYEIKDCEITSANF